MINIHVCLWCRDGFAHGAGCVDEWRLKNWGCAFEPRGHRKGRLRWEFFVSGAVPFAMARHISRVTNSEVVIAGGGALRLYRDGNPALISGVTQLLSDPVAYDGYPLS